MGISYLESLTPHIVTKPWGGEKLAQLKRLSGMGKIGETWEVSRLAEGPSRDRAGVSLENVFSDHELPYLVKFIDTSEALSIQVHPGDLYAKKNENSSGKTECWIILAAEPGAGLYLGFKKGVSQKAFFDAAKAGENLSDYLNFYPVAVGDFFYVPAETIHAIGAGITLAEVQQGSGVTYRVWDWNRKNETGQGRELHLRQAHDVLNFSAAHNAAATFKMKNIFLEKVEHVINHSDFNIRFYDNQFKLNTNDHSERVLSVVNLDQQLRIENEVSGEIHQLDPYHCCLVPNNVHLKISGGKCLLVD